MKLERISDNQIRCTLNKNDLTDRHLKLSELAYGSEKAKALFHEMMTQASEELGFEADDIPLVIEAIPVSSDCIILIITKVEDPEELDTRFSRFASAVSQAQDSDNSKSEDISYAGADEILNLLNRIKNDVFNAIHEAKETDPEAVQSEASDTPSTNAHKDIEITKLFTFDNLNDVTLLAKVLHGTYKGVSTLYKNPSTGIYYLVMNNKHLSPESFNRICNISTEYGRCEKYTETMSAYFGEHYECLIKNKALQVLSEL